MIEIPILVAGFLAAAVTSAVLGRYVTCAMLGMVNQKLPESEQISYLWGHYAK